jgi:hypothetical protein
LKTFESSAYYCGTLEARMSSFLTIIELKDENILLNKIDVEKEF